MRLRPPKIKKKNLTYSEFKEYVFSHTVIPKNQPVMEFFEELCQEHGYTLGLKLFLTLWPYEYQKEVQNIFLEYFNEKSC